MRFYDPKTNMDLESMEFEVKECNRISKTQTTNIDLGFKAILDEGEISYLIMKNDNVNLINGKQESS